ncbi:MAG: chemotaxis protein CheC [Solidesulfovibrio sp.]
MTPSSMQLDILQELINIGVGRAAGMLNQLVNTHIQLQVPVLRVLTPAQLADMYASRSSSVFSAVQLSFAGEFTGISALIFPPSPRPNWWPWCSARRPCQTTPPCAAVRSRKWATSY